MAETRIMKQPCQYCEERTMACHGTCQKYIEWRKYNDELRKKRKIEEQKERIKWY